MEKKGTSSIGGLFSIKFAYQAMLQCNYDEEIKLQMFSIAISFFLTFSLLPLIDLHNYYYYH